MSLEERTRELAEELALDLKGSPAVQSISKHFAQQEAELDLLRPVVKRASVVSCQRQSARAAAPTCRSPVESERLPRDQWCLFCEAREALGR